MLGNISLCRAKIGKKRKRKRRKTRDNIWKNFKRKLHGRITMKFSDFLIDDPEREIKEKWEEIIKKKKSQMENKARNFRLKNLTPKQHLS